MSGKNHQFFNPKKRKNNSVKSGHSVAFRKNPVWKYNINYHIHVFFNIQKSVIALVLILLII